jgi:hypothetical protein
MRKHEHTSDGKENKDSGYRVQLTWLECEASTSNEDSVDKACVMQGSLEDVLTWSHLAYKKKGISEEFRTGRGLTNSPTYDQVAQPWERAWILFGDVFSLTGKAGYARDLQEGKAYNGAAMANDCYLQSLLGESPCCWYPRSFLCFHIDQARSNIAPGSYSCSQCHTSDTSTC